MGSIIRKTWLLFIVQLIIYLTVPLMYLLMVVLFVDIHDLYLTWAPMQIFKPGAIMIGLGLASAYSAYFVGAVNWYINQALVVAATVHVNGLPYKGSLNSYAFSEVNKSLLVFSVRSTISRKTFKWIQTIKDSLLDKEILGGLFNHKWFIVRKAFGFLRSSMTYTLDMADEVLVSYTWMTTRIYKEFGPDGKKPPLNKFLKNQAKFFLEGFLHYIRCFPKLVISTAFPMIGANIVIGVTVLGVIVLCFSVFGLSWINSLWIIFFYSTICEWVKRVFFQYAHTVIIIDKFYKTLATAEPITMDTLISTISGIPVLANVAKKTGLKEFKDMKFDQSCPSDLLNISSIEEMIHGETSNLINVFKINDAPPESQEDTEYVSDEDDEFISEIEPGSEVPPDVPDEDGDIDITGDQDESDDNNSDNEVKSEDDEDEFDFEGMPSLTALPRQVKKVDM